MNRAKPVPPPRAFVQRIEKTAFPSIDTTHTARHFKTTSECHLKYKLF
jgi:hypothetical protein